ncbi:hypothetical protein RA279_28075, partial [Pseudomonas syringae pv. tagetis]|uniref:hypothetical protein n=1 Tax=Pseudomonas syringae group genomosp. 7 TaxID=251699 RepID=UPI00377064EE
WLLFFGGFCCFLFFFFCFGFGCFLCGWVLVFVLVFCVLFFWCFLVCFFLLYVVFALVGFVGVCVDLGVWVWVFFGVCGVAIGGSG